MEKKQKTKKVPAGGGGDEKKEHKKSWREYTATVEDIQQYLSDHIMLRYNLITRRVECHLLNRSPWDSYDGSNESAMQLLMDMQTQQTAREGDRPVLWRPVSDRIVNSLWKDMSKEKTVRIQDIYHVIESDFVTEYHPFRFYLEHLPPWNGGNHILAMSVSVRVKGGVDEQMRFYEYLRKWLVAMVAGWLDDEVVNHVILTFIGKQGIYKTTWFNYLLPPELRNYFYTKTNAGKLTKDDLLTLAQYALVCYEELDTMSPRELNQLKSAVTMPSIDERAPYAHFHEHRKHIASFCGTGNNTQFLSDDTGSRRWLPFEIESIESPKEHPFDYAAIYSEAYALYKQGFQYWFSSSEIRQLAEHNRQFETPQSELELVDYYFSLPSGADKGEFMPTAIAQQIVATPGIRVNTVALGRAFSRLGFEKAIVNNCRGYFVVRRKEEERRMRAHSLAYDSSVKRIQMTDHTDDS